MARKAITLRYAIIGLDTNGKRFIVSLGEGFTDDQRPEAYAYLRKMRQDQLTTGADPYAAVLLPEGRGGPYLPLDIPR